jgi:hypothetical protein
MLQLKCFARDEHLKRHVRSIHSNEKREYFPPFSGSAGGFDFSVLPLQRTSVPLRDTGRISAVMRISGSTRAHTRIKPCLAMPELVVFSTKTRFLAFSSLAFFFSLFVVYSLIYLGTSIPWDIAASVTGQDSFC